MFYMCRYNVYCLSLNICFIINVELDYEKLEHTYYIIVFLSSSFILLYK